MTDRLDPLVIRTVRALRRLDQEAGCMRAAAEGQVFALPTLSVTDETRAALEESEAVLAEWDLRLADLDPLDREDLRS